MKFKSIMHVSFFTDQLDVMRDFYENKLGLKAKMLVRYGVYKGSSNPVYGPLAETNPDDICLIYIEIAPGQFIELFPKMEGQGPHIKVNENVGYSHFALLVDDIFETRKEFEIRGIPLDTQISKGPSETYQMWSHDPDGNAFEVMQYTEKSLQVRGNC